jgi:4-hydroxy-tetrahydrodipicolinate synthase
MINRLEGIFTPLITPIHRDESPDLESLERLVRWQVESGIHGVWAMGTSGEFASFNELERGRVVETIVRTVGGRLPVIANVSDAATRLAIQHGKRAAAAGSDALAATPPYYYPHSQDELLAHYRAIREAVDLPLFIYNIPQTVRTHVELPTATTLAAEGTVAGIKDSQNNLEWFRQLTTFTQSRSLRFTAFAGTRYLIDAALLVGASGAIPSIANAFPELCVAAYEAGRAHEFARSAEMEQRIMEIESAAAIPAAGSRNAGTLGLIKAILSERGIIDEPRLALPLRTPSESERERMGPAVRDLLQGPLEEVSVRSTQPAM